MTSSLLWKITQGPFYRGKKQFEPQDFEIAPFQKDPCLTFWSLKLEGWPWWSHLTFINHILFGQGSTANQRIYGEDVLLSQAQCFAFALCSSSVCCCTRLLGLTHWHLEVIALNRLLLAGCNHIYIYIYILFLSCSINVESIENQTINSFSRRWYFKAPYKNWFRQRSMDALAAPPRTPLISCLAAVTRSRLFTERLADVESGCAAGCWGWVL